MLAVQMQGIVKHFGSVLANDHVDFDLDQGEIHALLGENGAGKTTLMRILYGLYALDAGEIQVGGQALAIRSPRDAIRAGVGMVTQHFTLVPTLSVAENIALGGDGAWIAERRAHDVVRRTSDRFGIPVDPGARVGELSVGEQQRVEILKALSRDARVLILDEPTAVLTPQEVGVLFEALDRLRREGLSVVFISHKLNEVMAVCDRVTVLRDGRRVGHAAKHETSPTALARMMVGRETFGVMRQGSLPLGGNLLRVENLTVRKPNGLLALDGVTFSVGAGEVLGIAGVSGNGQSELSQALNGMLKPAAGRIRVDGQDVTGASPAQMAAAGLGRIPEDRHASLVGELSVAENLVLDQMEAYTRGGALDRAAINRNAGEMIAAYAIKARPEDRVRTLSGGNMQKVLLARALSRNPRVIIAAEPTRGLDVGATEYVRARLLEQRDHGAAVVLISEDLDEILAMADRIAVIYEGRIMGILDAAEAAEETLGLMMAGTTMEPAHA